MTQEEFAKTVNQTKKTVLYAIEKFLPERFHHAIDDVVQETYIRAYRGLIKGNFSGKSALSTWLFAIARNESYRMSQKLRKEEEKFIKSVNNYKSNLNSETEDPWNFDSSELRDLIKTLPEKYSAVLEMLSLGFSERNIADELSLKMGTVKSRISRGRELLQRAWHSQISEGGKQT